MQQHGVEIAARLLRLHLAGEGDAPRNAEAECREDPEQTHSDDAAEMPVAESHTVFGVSGAS
jgi:hypothetical protein